eukprot:scaffold9519_cov183-Amphora_coffeaeformis.AAC.5
MRTSRGIVVATHIMLVDDDDGCDDDDDVSSREFAKAKWCMVRICTFVGREHESEQNQTTGIVRNHSSSTPCHAPMVVGGSFILDPFSRSER